MTTNRCLDHTGLRNEWSELVAGERYQVCTLHWDKPTAYIVNCVSIGEYNDMGTVGRSNYRVWHEDFASSKDVLWTEVYSGYGYYAVAVRADVWEGEDDDETPDDVRAIREALDSLENYPLLCDTDHSALECEEEDEAWKSDGASDLRRVLEKRGVETDDVTDDVLREWWSMVAEELSLFGGPACEHESDGGPYFGFEKGLDRWKGEWPEGAKVTCTTCDGTGVNGGESCPDCTDEEEGAA